MTISIRGVRFFKKIIRENRNFRFVLQDDLFKDLIPRKEIFTRSERLCNLTLCTRWKELNERDQRWVNLEIIKLLT